MTNIPDAPWVREAETFGPPGYVEEDVFCPVCGEANPDWMFIVDGDTIGCECCVKKVDAYEWLTRRNK